MADKPRRPAQLDAEQIEAIEGENDVAYNSELAHTSAQALYPSGTQHAPDSPEVTDRILELVRTEGVDVLAESWVRSPEDTLPGIFWRGYLLREWIRRDEAIVSRRWDQACQRAEAAGEEGARAREATPSPQKVREEWDTVFTGEFSGDVTDVLRDSARLAAFLATAEPAWIDSDSHPLATLVTRRNAAMAQTASEFAAAARLAAQGRLE